MIVLERTDGTSLRLQAETTEDLDLLTSATKVGSLRVAVASSTSGRVLAVTLVVPAREDVRG